MNYNDIDYNKLADTLLSRIKEYIDYEISNGVKTDNAIVSKVNLDGTVDIYFPPNKNKIFTKIQNQSVYQDLMPGDGVVLFYPNGNESSCWIIAKHQGGNVNFNTNNNSKNQII